jgi:hypothetical protein
VPLFEDIPGVGILFRPLPSAESSLQENVIMGQAVIFPTLFDLMGLRWAPAVADLDPLRTINQEFLVRSRLRDLKNHVYDYSASRVDEFLRIPPAERRTDLYRSQETIPYEHPDGYAGPGLNLRDSQLREGYDPQQLHPDSRFVPGDSRQFGPGQPGYPSMAPNGAMIPAPGYPYPPGAAPVLPPPPPDGRLLPSPPPVQMPMRNNLGPAPRDTIQSLPNYRDARPQAPREAPAGSSQSSVAGLGRPLPMPSGAQQGAAAAPAGTVPYLLNSYRRPPVQPSQPNNSGWSLLPPPRKTPSTSGSGGTPAAAPEESSPNR